MAIEARLATGAGPFLPAQLLRSQFDTLEPLAPDEEGLALDVDQSVDAIVEQYLVSRQE